MAAKAMLPGHGFLGMQRWTVLGVSARAGAGLG